MSEDLGAIDLSNVKDMSGPVAANVEDLRRIIDEAIIILETNKAFFTDARILRFLSIVAFAKEMKQLAEATFGIPPNVLSTYIGLAETLLGVEQRLVKSDLTGKLINMLTILKDRPVIL